MLQKGDHSYEFMDDWEKFKETSLPEKENLILQKFFQLQDEHSKQIKVKLDPLTDINMLLMVEKGIRGGMYHSIH